MDEDRAALIIGLCTQAGVLMEDASVLAVTLRGYPAERVGAALAELAAEVAAMAALLAAARALHARV